MDQNNRTCIQKKGETLEVCGCALNQIYNNGGSEALKGFIGLRMGLLELGQTNAKEMSKSEEEKFAEELFEHCRKNPMAIHSSEN